MKRLTAYLLPGEAVEQFWAFGGLGDELALLPTRLLLTRKSDGFWGVLSVPYRSVAAVEVSEAAMGAVLSPKCVRFRAGGEWVRVDVGGSPLALEIYAGLAGKVFS